MWEQIQSNRRKTALLIILMWLLMLLLGAFFGLFLYIALTIFAMVFICAIRSIFKPANRMILVVMLALIGILAVFGTSELLILKTTIIGMASATLVWVVSVLVSYFGGDKILLSASKATKVSRLKNPQIYNIAEEMKIAAGLTYTPRIYLVDDLGLNSFATGRDMRHSIIGVTSGLLEALTRDELQAVMAHEVAHIKNRDTLLMGMCAAFTGTATALDRFTENLTSRGDDGSTLQLVISAAAVIVLTPPKLSMTLVYLAISRKREYLADACAVSYTRYPPALASALRKIQRSTICMENACVAMSPIYINNPIHDISSFWAQRWNTHPPISTRIRILQSMSGGCSLVDYDNAYISIFKGRKGIINSRLYREKF